MTRSASPAVVPFQYESKEVRTIILSDGSPWFVAKDVCEVLGLGNSRQAVSKLDDDEKGVIKNDTLGGMQELSTISESGLYTLILRSNKPEAKPFRRWVTKEVLPAIRKTGRYHLPQRPQRKPAGLNPAQKDEVQRLVAETLAGMIPVPAPALIRTREEARTETEKLYWDLEEMKNSADKISKAVWQAGARVTAIARVLRDES